MKGWPWLLPQTLEWHVGWLVCLWLEQRMYYWEVVVEVWKAGPVRDQKSVAGMYFWRLILALAPSRFLCLLATMESVQPIPSCHDGLSVLLQAQKTVSLGFCHSSKRPTMRGIMAKGKVWTGKYWNQKVLRPWGWRFYQCQTWPCNLNVGLPAHCVKPLVLGYTPWAVALGTYSGKQRW